MPEGEKAALAERKNVMYLELLAGMSHDDLYPGIVVFLEKLAAASVKLGLCSSSRNAGVVLERLGLTRRFDVMVTGHDFERPKPDPEIFLLAAAKLGVEPARCVVFEDAPSGVEAALAAGMACVGVGSADVLSQAPAVIRRYDEIDLDGLLRSGRIKDGEAHA